MTHNSAPPTTTVGSKFTCVNAPGPAVPPGLKVKCPSSRSSDVRVARVPFPTPTDTIAVAAVFMKTSEYQTKPATCIKLVKECAL